jgi:DNA ligase (NAD+)
MSNELEISKNHIIFHSKDGKISLDVMLKGESVWLTQGQMSDLFQRDKRTISDHIKRIFKEKELNENSVVRKFRTTATDEKEYNVSYYNLDVIISVGYRVKSYHGTQFRIWASGILKQHLLKGYTLNQKRISEQSLRELTNALGFIQRALKETGNITDMGENALEIIQKFAKTWHLLLAYDEDKLSIPQDSESIPNFDEEAAEEAIHSLAKELREKGEATDLFARPRDKGIKEILGNIHQTFDGKMLYPTVRERAAHLLYFVIKDHPFLDGNKRTASFLFLLYLKQHGIDTSKITNEALATLALLVAQSQPRDKEIIVKLILNMI